MCRHPAVARSRCSRGASVVRVDARRSPAGAAADAAPQVHLGSRHSRRLMIAVVLLSGGLDSYTAAAIARAEGFTLAALPIPYGQRHVEEIAAARRVADALGITRRLALDIDLRGIGGPPPPS